MNPLNSFSHQIAHQNFTVLQRMKNWMETHPTVLKIIKIGAILLTFGIVALLPCTRDWVSLSAPTSLRSARVLIQTGQPNFSRIDSSRLQRIESPGVIAGRNDFLHLNRATHPPLIGKSDFVSLEMTTHLMRHKKDRALGVKYVPGDQITHMEGAMHTFVTPVCSIVMTGDIHWAGREQGNLFGNHQVRPMILSASIHPDFETDQVVLPLVRIGNERVEGAVLPDRAIPTAAQKMDPLFRQNYDEGLKKEMIYHLSPDHALAAMGEIAADQILNQEQALARIEAAIGRPLDPRPLQGLYLRLPNDLISLELLFQIYVQQIRNEFKVLNPATPQGYVYTVSPPSIFARYLGGAALMNRVQALAFQAVVAAEPHLFSYLRVFAFSNYADPGAVALFQRALPSIRVVSHRTLFSAEGSYVGPRGFALVVHNNSDGFGQNIETEGPTSMDGVIGSYSDAALPLNRERADLLHFVY